MGENRIVVAPGANGHVASSDAQQAVHALSDRVGVVLLQLEIPLPTVLAAARAAKDEGMLVILDPAPAPSEQLPSGCLADVDLLLPNEHEAALLTGRPVYDERTARLAASQMVADLGCGGVIVKLGAQGAYVATGAHQSGLSQGIMVPALHVEAVDTTAAGDCYAGALATALMAGTSMISAARWANGAAAVSVTRRGAQESLPWLHEVEALAGETHPPDARKGG